ncbi:MAG: hypothetical protein HUJ55_08790 [Ileibacterium sp.]|nr:hypothetical protein [Ileibacterium sp.]
MELLKKKPRKSSDIRFWTQNLLVGSLLGIGTFLILNMIGVRLWQAIALGGIISSAFGMFLYGVCFGDPFRDDAPHQ